MGKRRGWRRLAIALSIVWALVVCARVTYEYFVVRPSDRLWFVEYVPGSVPDPKDPRFVPDVPSVKVVQAVFAAILPIGAVWLVVLSVWSVSWIRAGFR